ncbi:hypothetical protein ACJMK2_031418 [Sinanodonta woodiana]|uniref:Mannosyltransferase n=1 Tax=Sinanodonta woodiana TaxID=1069815 RepID=A0ABD3X060_SINWO
MSTSCLSDACGHSTRLNQMKMSRQTRIKVCVFACGALILTWIWFKVYKDHPILELRLPRECNLSTYTPFSASEPLKLVINGTPKIENIIHQYWIDHNIPATAEQHIKSLRKNHLGWKYVLWTAASTQLLLRTRYPGLTSMFDLYAQEEKGSYAVRYIMLYEFGGAYVDLGLKSLRPLDPLFNTYSCILARVLPEIPSLLYNFDFLLSNDFIACRKKHPFMKVLVENLPVFSEMAKSADASGPNYMTLVFKDYMNIDEYNFTSGQYMDLFLAPAEYFFPTIQSEEIELLLRICETFNKLSFLRQRACVSLSRYGLRRTPSQFAFTHHYG